jgi:hypothetical protein
MNFDDPQMEEYFASLPVVVQGFIVRSELDISTLDELMMIGERFMDGL